MAFLFRSAKIHGIPYGRCGIRKEEEIKEIPEVPDIPSHELDDIVDKASTEPEWKPIHDGADESTPMMANEIINVTEEVKEKTNMSLLMEGITALSGAVIFSAIPWDLYDKGLDDTKNVMGKVLNKVGKDMVKTLPKEYQKDFKFETNSERAMKWIDKQGANLVKQVGDETKKSIRREITKAIREGLGSDRTANNVINLIGLTERQAAAVTNFRKRLEEAGVSQKRIERETKKYSKRLLEYRASNIARTELMNAANQGHLEMLRQGIDQDLIPKDIEKIWIVTPDDRLCEYCKPMEGQKKPIEEEFTSNNGNVDRPPLHPMCRCVMGVEFNK